MILAEPFETASHKRDHYLRMMHTAQQLGDQVLIQLIVKKLARLGRTDAVSTSSGCVVIPFPTVPYPSSVPEYEPPSLWMLVKLTLAVPGSVAFLFYLAIFHM
jgi:hypothetical protein